MAVDLSNPCSFPGAFAYEHTDIPPGMTATEWRRERAVAAREAKAARRAARRRRAVALLTGAALPARLARPSFRSPAGVAR